MNIRDKIKENLLENKSLLILCVLVLVAGTFRGSINSLANNIHGVNETLAVIIYIIVGLIFLPTAPLNILYGAMYGERSATIIVSLATVLIIGLQAYMRNKLPMKRSSGKAIIGRLRRLDLPLYLKLLLIRSNPILPLFLSTALISQLSRIEKIKGLALCFIYTMPASYLLAASASYNGERERMNSIIVITMIIILSCPVFLISKKFRHTVKEILKYRDNEEINNDSD